MILSIPEPRKKRPERQLYAYVYAGWDGAGRIKVGVTMDPERRRRQIETAAGIRFEAFTATWQYAPGACERWFLNKSGLERRPGEWLQGSRENYDWISNKLIQSQAVTSAASIHTGKEQ